MFKWGKDNGHDTWKMYFFFQIIFFLIFSNICCMYTFELPLWGNSNVYLQHVFSINEFITISVFLTNSQPLSFIQRNEHAEMNNFSCSLSCTWMTIIDCLLYPSGSLSWDVSWEFFCYIASYVVVTFFSSFTENQNSGSYLIHLFRVCFLLWQAELLSGIGEKLCRSCSEYTTVRGGVVGIERSHDQTKMAERRELPKMLALKQETLAEIVPVIDHFLVWVAIRLGTATFLVHEIE